MKSSSVTSCAIHKRRLKLTCLDKETIKGVIKEYNKNVADVNAPTPIYPLPISGSKFELYQLLKSISGNTKDVDLWKSSFIKDKKLKLQLQKFTFKPKGPKGEWGWLSNYDITDTMNQYSLAYTRSRPFHYFGTFPADYFQLNPDEIRRLIGITRSIPAGLVLNTDPTKQPGQHWVSIFVSRSDPENQEINVYYFDSLHKKPNKHIEKFLSNFENVTIETDNNTLQKKDGVCGLYAICYILTKVNQFYDVTSKIGCLTLGDTRLNLMRRKIFRQIRSR